MVFSPQTFALSYMSPSSFSGSLLTLRTLSFVHALSSLQSHRQTWDARNQCGCRKRPEGCYSNATYAGVYCGVGCLGEACLYYQVIYLPPSHSLTHLPATSFLSLNVLVLLRVIHVRFCSCAFNPLSGYAKCFPAFTPPPLLIPHSP